MLSIFNFYIITALLRDAGWPRRKSLFNSTAIFNSVVFDASVNQMIDISACIGACRPKLALQIIATMFRDTDWKSKKALDINQEVNNFKKQWTERGNSSNPREAIKPIKYSELEDEIAVTQFKDKNVQLLLEGYFYESLIWGLVNSNSFKSYFEEDEKRAREHLTEYKKAKLEIDYIPTLDQFIKEAEKMLRGYEKEVRPLSLIPQKLLQDVLSLEIEVNN